MARPGFYNDNLGRSYPFVFGSTALLPDFAICDFGCIAYAGSGFVDDLHNVTLLSVRKYPTYIAFEFTSNAPGLVGRLLRFTRLLTAERYETELTHITKDSEGNPEVFVNGQPVWTGYLVTGDVSALTTVLDSVGGELTPNAVVEPSLIQNLAGSYAGSISAVNSERTRADSSDGCRALCWSFEPSDYYRIAEYLTGPVLFKEGYNANIRLDTSRNAIKIEARLGAGEGQVQQPVKVTPEEEPPAGRTTLDGALACDEVIRSISGVSRRYFSIDGRRGVVVTSIPEEHKLVIDVRMNQMVRCPEVPEQSEFVAGEPSVDPCECGPDLG